MVGEETGGKLTHSGYFDESANLINPWFGWTDDQKDLVHPWTRPNDQKDLGDGSTPSLF